MRRGRHGLTLVELLVAMSILLVGIYAVARGFPALFGNLESERIRTEMARRVGARMERLKTNPTQIPTAITGHDPIATNLPDRLISPELYPEEDMDPIPGNPRDDLTLVVAEAFTAPIVQSGQDHCVYPLQLGPAESADLQVNRVQKLERTEVGMTLGDNDFYLDEDGFLYAPASITIGGVAYSVLAARVDYIWVDANGEQHGVLGEIVDNASAVATPNPVRAASVTTPAAFANVIPEMTSATALMRYTTMIGQATDINWQTTTGTAMLESNYGATLMLPAADAGARMEVTYRQKSEQDYSGNFRRVPLMVEEMAAPATAPYTVDLAFRGIAEMNPLYSEGIDGSTLVDDTGNALDPQQVYVLIVDLASGATWTDVEPWVSLDFREGQLQLNWDDASAPMAAADARGRDLRVYYRTIDGHTIVVQKAPDWFVEDAIYQTYADPYKVDYRTYQVTDDPDDNRYTQLLFPLSAGDQIVMIDYVAGASPPYERISGELHAIPGDTLAVTLNRPDVRGILAVRGVSMTVRGWWHEPGGRVEMVGIDTFLTPESLL